MKKLTVIATKNGEYRDMSVMARGHRQYIWSRTTLIGVTKTGARRLKKFVERHQGWEICLDVPHKPLVQGWEEEEVFGDKKEIEVSGKIMTDNLASLVGADVPTDEAWRLAGRIEGEIKSKLTHIYPAATVTVDYTVENACGASFPTHCHSNFYYSGMRLESFIASLEEAIIMNWVNSFIQNHIED